MSMPTGEKSLLLRCVQCEELYAGSATNDGTLIPESPTSGGRCHECGDDEFEQVTLSSE